jgi:predicted deacylase
VIITGGVHGDEPSGALLLPELRDAGLVTFGPCNPWGVANDSRFLADGRDLNRSFHRDDCPEAEAVRAFLAEHPPALLLDLHEDAAAPEAYLIQHGPDDDLGERIVAALEGELAFHPRPSFALLTGENGVLKPSALVLRGVALSRFYGLAFHAWLTYGCTTFVVECPGQWSLDDKKRCHRLIVETAHRLFDERD